MIEADLDAVAGEVINVATGRDAWVLEIADFVLELCGKPATLKEHVEERPGQVARHIGSTAKAERLLGGPSHVAQEGLSRTVAWYRENASWVDSSLCCPGRRGEYDLSSAPSAQRSWRRRRPR